MTLTFIFTLLAFLCFIGAAAGVPNPPRVALGWLGLAFWVLPQLIR